MEKSDKKGWKIGKEKNDHVPVLESVVCLQKPYNYFFIIFIVGKFISSSGSFVIPCVQKPSCNFNVSILCDESPK